VFVPWSTAYRRIRDRANQFTRKCCNTKSNTSILSALVYSSLISAPRNTEGWNQSQYVFSRFVADCAKAVGLDAVKYPTTRASSGHNLVIFDESYRLPTEWQVKAIVSYDGKKATPLTVT
jgi:hypothetical protein